MRELFRSWDYLRLWAGVGGAFMGVWIETTAAQWFLVSSAATAALAPIVLAAVTLPMALLGPISGALTDGRDRRRILLVVQLCALGVGLVLTLLAMSDRLQATSLLVLTALLGSSAALTLTPIQSLVPDVVTRRQIPDAAALLAVAGNGARVLGPAIAGAALAWTGHTAVFASITVTSVLLVTFLSTWSFREKQGARPEPFLRSMATGLRFVWYSPQAVKLVARGAWFTACMTAVFALLPLIGSERLHVDASGFGLLLAAQGAGAVAGGLVLPSVRRRVDPDRLVIASFLIGAGVTALMVLVTSPAHAWVLLAVGGCVWTATLGTLVPELQMYLPAWVRARGISLLYSATFGGQAIGAATVGVGAHRFGITSTLLLSAAALLIGLVMPIGAPLRRLDHLDRSPSAHWPDPTLVVDPSDIDNEMVVTIRYMVGEADEEAFIASMWAVRRIRLRTGGSHWRLLKDAEIERRYVEQFTVSSWDEYERQRHDRMIASDREFEEQAARLSLQAPCTSLMFRVG